MSWRRTKNTRSSMPGGTSSLTGTASPRPPCFRNGSIAISPTRDCSAVETPDASNSPWVEHEVAVAYRRKLGLMSLALPETPKSKSFRPFCPIFATGCRRQKSMPAAATAAAGRASRGPQRHR